MKVHRDQLCNLKYRLLSRGVIYISTATDRAVAKFMCTPPPHTLGPSINGLFTDGNTKLCCRGFILALFQSTTANKIDSEHTQDYKTKEVTPYMRS